MRTVGDFLLYSNISKNSVLGIHPLLLLSHSSIVAFLYRVVSERTVDRHIKKLRKKLNVVRPDDDPVQSVYSVGYKLVL
ncbi:winged helix-turn-helix domain-containing protein [Enterovibrio baiacu]|uniref:winged helix-turn-helix domain-containing protein n=1 Tax=Enterovibrio baiacu TaxID=2491023 RepID=UPI0030B855B8